MYIDYDSLWSMKIIRQEFDSTQQEIIIDPVAPVAYQVILEPGIIGQFREFEPRRVHTRINSLGLFLRTN